VIDAIRLFQACRSLCGRFFPKNLENLRLDWPDVSSGSSETSRSSSFCTMRYRSDYANLAPLLAESAQVDKRALSSAGEERVAGELAGLVETHPASQSRSGRSRPAVRKRTWNTRFPWPHRPASTRPAPPHARPLHPGDQCRRRPALLARDRRARRAGSRRLRSLPADHGRT
jgi:hypothetical protein